MASFLHIYRLDVCSLEPAFLRFLFFLSGELLFNKTVEQHEPDFLLNRTYEIFSRFFFSFRLFFP